MYKNPSFMSVRIAPGLKKIRTDELRASVPPTVKEKHHAIYGAQKNCFRCRLFNLISEDIL